MQRPNPNYTPDITNIVCLDDYGSSYDTQGCHKNPNFPTLSDFKGTDKSRSKSPRDFTDIMKGRMNNKGKSSDVELENNLNDSNSDDEVYDEVYDEVDDEEILFNQDNNEIPYEAKLHSCYKRDKRVVNKKWHEFTEFIQNVLKKLSKESKDAYKYFVYHCSILRHVTNEYLIENAHKTQSKKTQELSKVLINYYSEYGELLEKYSKEYDRIAGVEDVKLSINIYTSAFNCSHMKLQKKTGYNLLQKFGFGTDDILEGLTIPGILTTLLMSIDHPPAKNIYVSPLFYTWATAILLYGPVTSDTLNLYVSPYLTTPDFSYRNNQSKRSILTNFFSLLEIIKEIFYELYRDFPSTPYAKLCKKIALQIIRLLRTKFDIYTYNIAESKFQHTTSIHSYSIQLPTVDINDIREIKDYIIYQSKFITHLPKEIEYEFIKIKRTKQLLNTIDDNQNKTNKDFRGDLDKFIRFYHSLDHSAKVNNLNENPDTCKKIDIVIPFQLIATFLEKTNVKQSGLQGYILKLNKKYDHFTNKYDDFTYEEQMEQFVGFPFPKFENTITSCEYNCSFYNNRNCRSKMKKIKTYYGGKGKSKTRRRNRK